MQAGRYLVPAPLISSIANLRHGGCHKFLSELLRDKLVSHDRSCGYDGYRVTSSGYDILALEQLKRRGVVVGLGDKIGIGKESDVYLGVTREGRQVVLKFHRLGRTSFRNVKEKRDYFVSANVSKNKKNGTRFGSQGHSWLFLSRTSAVKEYAFMKALHDVGYPTPEPLGNNRHVVVMGLVRGAPLYQIKSNRVSGEQAQSIFKDSVELAERLFRHGLVHCDLNEFNLMVDMSGIQTKVAMDDSVADHYVRHSGMSVASMGALSAHAPIAGQRFEHRDGTGEMVSEKPPLPTQLLENGEPKPIVTLIDFPQMVSTHHPNAKEFFERDLQCLKRFFEKKLKCVPDEGWDAIMPKWEDLRPGEHVEDSLGLVSKVQLRLDQELQLHEIEESQTQTIHPTQHFSEEEGLQDYNSTDEHSQNQTIDQTRPSEDDGLQEDDISADKHSQNQTIDPTQLHKIPSEDESLQDDDISADEEVPEVFMADETTLRAMETKAKERVRRQLDGEKKSKIRKGAFRSKNKNKEYCKGRRVASEKMF